MSTTDVRPPAELFNTGKSYSYTGNENFHRNFCDLLDGAAREVVDYVVPETRPDEHDQFILQGFANAGRRGVKCRTLVSPEHIYLVQSTWTPNFDLRGFLQKAKGIRLVEKVHGPFTVVDRKKVLLNIPNPQEPGEYTTSVVVEDERLAEHLIAEFDRIWEETEPQQEALLSAWEARRG